MFSFHLGAPNAAFIARSKHCSPRSRRITYEDRLYLPITGVAHSFTACFAHVELVSSAHLLSTDVANCAHADSHRQIVISPSLALREHS